MSADEIIEKSIEINASTSSVWETITNPDQIRLWMSDSEINVESDFKVGSPIVFSGKLHGLKFRDEGTILKFEPETVFSYSHLSHISKLPLTPENSSVIEFRLESKETHTLLTVHQSNFVAKASYEHWNFYWNVTLGILKKVIESN